MEILEHVVQPGLSYDGSEPVRIHVRTRDRRIDLDDGGLAVAKAGVGGRGWLPVAERVVAAEGFNVNRRGVIFVPVVSGRDIEELARRLAATSVDLYSALLELGDV